MMTCRPVGRMLIFPSLLTGAKSLTNRMSKPASRRDYETVGYVIGGAAELQLEGQVVRLEPGDSWVVPAGAEHTYRILEEFTALEATSPPAHAHGRDEPGR